MMKAQFIRLGLHWTLLLCSVMCCACARIVEEPRFPTPLVERIDHATVEAHHTRWKAKNLQNYTLTVVTFEQWSHTSITLEWTMTVKQGNISWRACRPLDTPSCPPESVFANNDLSIDGIYKFLNANTSYPQNSINTGMSYPQNNITFNPVYEYPQRIVLYQNELPVFDIQVKDFTSLDD